jgi:hypothetical protein
MRTLAGAILAIFATLAASQALADEPDCRLKEVASLPMIPMSDGRFVVPITVQDRELKMMPSFGNDPSSVKASVASDLKVDIRTLGRGGMNINGQFVNAYIDVPTLTIGRVSSDSAHFAIAPQGAVPQPADGILAMDILGHYDLELDFKQGKLNLFMQDHCAGNVVYWTKSPYTDVKLDYTSVPLQLDGHGLYGWIDLQSTDTYLDVDTISTTAGWKDPLPEAQRLGSSNTYFYPFKVLAFGGVAVQNPHVILYEPARSAFTSIAQDQPLAIGLDILRQLHMFFAFSENKLYITPADAH